MLLIAVSFTGDVDAWEELAGKLWHRDQLIIC